MASVMPFPNVATHRRMPHLSKEPKATSTPKPTVDIDLPQQQQLQTTVLPPHSSVAPPSDRTDSSSNDSALKAIASSSSSTTQQQQLQNSTTGKGHLTLSTTATTSPYGKSNNNAKQITSGASSSSSLPLEGAGGYSSTTPLTSASTVSTPLADPLHHSHQLHNIQDHESSLHGHGHDREHPPQLLLQHNQHQQQPLNAPHGSSTINHQHHPASSSTSPFPHAAPLPPSGTVPILSSCPSNASATHESRLIKSALYDAFGCLYHPVQHTHTPCSPSGLCSGNTSQAGKLPMCATSSQTQVQQRSGEVTPSSLISPSPRAMSPMLRPHLGPSAPITPLELCSENGFSSHGYGSGGYFGIVHGHGSGLGSSSSSMSSRQSLQQQHLGPNHYHTHHSHHSINGHGQQQHTLPPAPSILNRTGSLSKHKPQHHHHHQEDTLLHPQSHHHHDSSTGSNSSLLSRKSSLGDIHLDPTEHPVLCSLQTLSLTHPHPANHYHPHLGHDLGHDRVSISDPDLSNGSGSERGMTTIPLTPSGVLSKANGPKA
ncbi:hypothetical protein BGZ90_010503 [Linnemannia elongata]|nr:hypothetical protein BGZ90_010503 [Linnemannia elongata]